MVRVLLVEDDPQIAKSLSMSLELDGFGVQRKETVASAWEELGRSAYDVLLLDVGLPDGSGIDLCQRLRAQGNTVPVLFLSARTDEETVVRGIEQGGDDYIRKPFGISELKARIQKVLRGNGANGNILRAGPLMVDVDKRVVTLQGRTLPLGKREFDLVVAADWSPAAR